MPGQILEIKVKEGDKVRRVLHSICREFLFIPFFLQVTPKQPLFVLSAMKMEMVIDSPMAGTIKKIHATAGTKCAAGDLVIEIEP